MQTIWKYPLTEEVNVLEIPKDAKFLDMQLQNGKPTIWLLLNSEKEKEKRVIAIIGTGWDIKHEIRSYLGTFQDGSLVFHVFEIAL